MFDTDFHKRHRERMDQADRRFNTIWRAIWIVIAAWFVVVGTGIVLAIVAGAAGVRWLSENL